MKTIMHKASFTMLKSDVDYREMFEETLKKFQYEKLYDKTARKWIAQSLIDTLLLDIPESTDSFKKYNIYEKNN